LGLWNSSFSSSFFFYGFFSFFSFSCFCSSPVVTKMSLHALRMLIHLKHHHELLPS
jgi:hypothetical protein